MQSDIHCKSFFPGYYYPARDLNVEANSSFWHANNFSRIIATNGYQLHGFCSPPHHLGNYQESLKQTMLKHEAIFEDQIHELHRLYRRQKELMAQVEGTALYRPHIQPETFHSNAPGTFHALGLPLINLCNPSGISDSKANDLPVGFTTGKTTRVERPDPHQEGPAKHSWGSVKFGKKALDLELPAYEYIDSDDENILEEEKTNEVPDWQNDLDHSCNPLKMKCLLDLNEPIKVEETSESESNYLGAPVTGLMETQCQDESENVNAGFRVLSNVKVEELQKMGDSETSANELHSWKEKVQTGSLCKDGKAGSGIDLNLFPQLLCEEKLSTPEEPQESFSVSSRGKRNARRSLIVVQALPCFNGFAYSGKRSKSSIRGISRPNKKSKGSLKVDLNSSIKEDGSSLPTSSLVLEKDFEAPVSPENMESTRPSMESDNNQPSLDKENSSSPPNVESDQTQNNLQNKECYRAMEEDELERAAAEVIVGISASCVQTSPQASAYVMHKKSPLGNLHWFANLACSVVDDPEREFGLSLSGCQENYFQDNIDYFEAMTLQLSGVKVEEYSCNKSNNGKPEASIPDFIPTKPRRGRSRRGRPQRKDFQNDVLPSLASLSRNEVTEDLQMIGGLMEACGAQWENVTSRNKGKSWFVTRGRRPSCGSPPKAIDTILNSCVPVEGRRVLEWGPITRRRRGPRSPAGSFRPILGKV